MGIVVDPFVRNCAANWFGPTKPKGEPQAPPIPVGREMTSEEKAAYRAALNTLTDFKKTSLYKKYSADLEVFVHDITSKIATGSLIGAIATAAAGIFSIISPLFMLVVTGVFTAIYFDAKTSAAAAIKTTNPNPTKETTQAKPNEQNTEPNWTSWASDPLQGLWDPPAKEDSYKAYSKRVDNNVREVYRQSAKKLQRSPNISLEPTWQ